MKSKFTAVLVGLLALVIAGSLTGIVGAQGSPQDVVKSLADAGYIPTADGTLIAQVDQEQIDLTGEDNMIRRTYFAEEDAYGDIVVGTTIRWGTDDTEDSCGFVIREADDANYYVIEIDRENQIVFTELYQGEWQSSLYVDSPATDISANGQNDLVIVAVGDTMYVVVNGEPTAKVTDDSSASGKVSVSMSTYESSDVTACTFLNPWLWEIATDTGPGITLPPLSSGVTTLTDFDKSSQEAVAELEDAGLIPAGGTEIFREPSAYFEGSGYWYTPLASQRPHTNIVVAGELDFIIGDIEEFEHCGLMSRIDTNANGDAVVYIQVSLTNNGDLLAIDQAVEGAEADYEYVPLGLDMGQPHHILYILTKDTLTVFVDGEPVLEDMTVRERSGTYGISLVADGPTARCEGTNLWAHSVDSVISLEGECGVMAGGDVNLRAGPGTDYDRQGTLSGGEIITVDGQAEGADGFVWWRLETGAWVRSDLVTARGACADVPTVTP
ncbi:MAG: SH3 domain-containing protein [Anaerolineae bacterium]|nr:SH3 domain-containing protein [Anaerolineae bacterium]